MIFPKFIKEGSTIGICAPSAGVGDKLETFQPSMEHLKQLGFSIKETQNVYSCGKRSADAYTRAEEVNSLFSDNSVDFVATATGGDFLSEILPYVDWKEMQMHPKWLMGASDPTSLLFTYTTKYDVATLYGVNAGSFDDLDVPYIRETLGFMHGDFKEEHSSQLHAEVADFLPTYEGMNKKTVWYSNKDEFHLQGRMIGGCIDSLKDLIGTQFDDVRHFDEKYQEDGLIWYFDNFSMTAENFYRTLLQMKYAGWLTHAKGVLLGRVLFPSSETGMTYKEALERALGDLPYVYEADIGHTLPRMTMINGAFTSVDFDHGKATIAFMKEK